MVGILTKFYNDAVQNPDRLLYNFLDCETTPFQEHPVTVHQAWQKACDMADALRRNGAQKGDRAIILSMQDAGTVYAVWGCMLAGVVFTVIPPPIDEGKLTRFISVLKSCKPKFLISNEKMEKESDTNVTGPLLKKAFMNVISLKRIYTDKITPTKQITPPPVYDPEDLIYLQYTSGSTSEPKGVMVAYKNLMGCIEQVLEIFDFTKGRHKLASWVPFYHNIGLIVAIFLPVIATHGTAYFIPTLQFLAKPTVWLKVISDYKINITAAPNSAYDVCTRLIRPQDACQYDLRHVTHLINGSEFVNNATVENFCELFGLEKSAFAPGYGLSECVCIGTLSSMDFRCAEISLDSYRQGQFLPVPQGDKAIVSVGRPAGDMRIVAIRSDGTPCDPGEIGEICIQGSSVCSGYWQNPEQTKRFHTEIPGYEGLFYSTGDMGVMYEGQLYLTGRIKEMLIVNGKNIFPGDITLMLKENSVNIPTDSTTVFSVLSSSGEKPVLCTEVVPGMVYPELISQINRLTARNYDFSFQDIVFVESGSLPRTDNRKIKTLAARAMYEDGGLPVVYSLMTQNSAQSSTPDESPSPSGCGPIILPENALPHQIQPVIYGLFQQMLPGIQFGIHDSFLELGGDSLSMMELLATLEQDLNIEIDPRRMASNPTVAGISAHLSALLNGIDDSELVDLSRECVLEEDIRPERDYDFRAEDCKNILLTGASGFLGAYLIHSLISQRKNSGLQIYCHVRAASPEKGMERIIANLKRFKCWDECYRDFIIPIPGDLSKDNMGMEPEIYAELLQKIDMVYHNGAILNFVYPYSQMKQTNVTGTAQSIRFACSGRPKYFCYISSYSVYDNPSHFGKTVLESDPLDSHEGYFLGYSETKWVAEKLVMEARERGLRTAVFRPGDITGTAENGLWKLDDLISRSFVGCIQMGYVPDVEVNLHLTPVDYVADAITYISFCSESYGQAFNLINHNILPLNQITRLMQKAGYPVKKLPYAQWCDALAATSGEENVLRVLSCLFTDKRLAGESLIERYGKNQAQFDTANTDRALSGSGYACPPVDEKLMKIYLKNFQNAGHLPKPLPIWKRFFIK